MELQPQNARGFSFLFLGAGWYGVKQKQRVRESESERNGIMELARHGLGREKRGDGGPHTGTGSGDR
jgi:hypothetical protein